MLCVQTPRKRKQPRKLNYLKKDETVLLFLRKIKRETLEEEIRKEDYVADTFLFPKMEQPALEIEGQYYGLMSYDSDLDGRDKVRLEHTRDIIRKHLEMLAKLQDDTKPDGQIEAASWLAYSGGSKEAIALLETLLQSGDSEVRTAAKRALWLIGVRRESYVERSR